MLSDTFSELVSKKPKKGEHQSPLLLHKRVCSPLLGSTVIGVMFLPLCSLSIILHLVTSVNHTSITNQGYQYKRGKFEYGTSCLYTSVGLYSPLSCQLPTRKLISKNHWYIRVKQENWPIHYHRCTRSG